MNWDAIGAVGEVIGAVAVVVSIIYLAIQVRQSNHTAEAATTFDGSRLLAEWHRGITQSNDLAAIWIRGMEGEQDFTEEDRARFMFAVAELMILMEALHRQFRLGYISEDAWAPAERIMFNVLANPAVAKWWGAEVSVASRTFRNYVNERMAMHAGDPSWGSHLRETVLENPNDGNAT